MAFATVHGLNRATPGGADANAASFLMSAFASQSVTLQAGDVVYICIQSNGQTISAPTETGKTWNLVGAAGTSGGPGAGITGGAVYWRRLDAGETDVSVTIGDSGDHQLVGAFAIRGCAPSGTPHEQVTTGTGAASSTHTATAGTTTKADGLVTAVIFGARDFGAGGQYSSPTNASLASVTERADWSTNTANGGQIGVFTGQKATAGAAGTFSVTNAASTTWAYVTFSIFIDTVAYNLALDSGSYAISGQTVALKIGYTNPATPGSYTLSGTATGLVQAQKIAIAPGSYILSGQAVALPLARPIALVPGSYELTGTAVVFGTGKGMQGDVGQYLLNGQDAIFLRPDLHMESAPGSYSLTGQATATSWARAAVAEVGAYTLTGQVLQLPIARPLALAAGSYVLTGTAAITVLDRPIALSPGGYTLSGSNLTLRQSQLIGMVPGSYSLTGQLVGISQVRTLALAPGSYTLTGTLVSLGKFLALRIDRSYVINVRPEQPIVNVRAEQWWVPCRPGS